MHHVLMTIGVAYSISHHISLIYHVRYAKTARHLAGVGHTACHQPHTVHIISYGKGPHAHTVCTPLKQAQINQEMDYC